MDATSELIRAFAAAHPDDVARVLETSEEVDSASLLGELTAESAGAVVRDMVPALAARRLHRLRTPTASAIVHQLSLDVTAALLSRMKDDERRPILDALDRGPRERSLRQLLSHEPNTAGAWMDPQVLIAPRSVTVAEALERVRAEPANALYYLYVLGDGGQLEGVVNQRELMLASPDVPLHSIMTVRLQMLLSSAGAAAIVSHPGWQRVHAMPVVDAQGIFLGAIRYKTVRRLERELGRAARAPAPEVTARALAEFYGLAASGLGEWAMATVRGPSRGGSEEP